MKSLALSPFLPGNKRLLNDKNDHNPENTDTSLSEKDDMSHTSRDDLIGKTKSEKKTLTMMTNTRRKIRNFKTVMKVLIIKKLQILCVVIVLSRQPKNKKH